MNGPLRRVALALFIAFMVLVLDVTYWQVIAADRLRDDARNSRVLLTQSGRERGLIISSDNETLAISIGDPGDTQRFLRDYPHGDLYAHTVGFSSLLFGDVGIEGAFADELTSGRDLTVSGILSALFGGEVNARSLQLTLNHQLQLVADQALNGQTGAVVAIDPENSAILAMVSSPSFDPNTLIGPGASAAWEALTADPFAPLKSRATGESYPPGSTFKTIVATAALETGAAGPDTPFPNTSSIDLPRVDGDNRELRWRNVRVRRRGFIGRIVPSIVQHHIRPPRHGSGRGSCRRRRPGLWLQPAGSAGNTGADLGNSAG